MELLFKAEIGGRTLSLQTGKVAKQASGAVMVQYGETMVLVTVVSSDEQRIGADFLPLSVEYQEKIYAAGRIPGNYFRREIGRPSEKETLTARLIDRPIRPLFPKKYNFETQVIATVLSMDQENDPDTLAMIGASAALEISDIPFDGPIASIRIGRIDGELMINPTLSEYDQCDINIIVAGSKNGVVMVEGGSNIVSEADMLEAIFFGHRELQPLIDIQEPGKTTRSKTLRSLKGRILEDLGPEYAERKSEIDDVFNDLKRRICRDLMLREGRRIVGRRFDEIRPISCEVGVLPRPHGSALFTRGETQVLGVLTLGSGPDEQRVETLIGEEFRPFMLHYNFPPYSVGEVKRIMGPSRRDIGHGGLSTRALEKVIPNKELFEYTIRIVSEVFESNGSSSMGTVCSASLALMDGGVPIKAPVSGIAMGLVKEGQEVIVLSDILGDEDHMGDMDFKVAGTREGITALQMDIKIKSLSEDILKKALEQARVGRIFILDKMLEALKEPRKETSPYAPKMISTKINPDKIREIIGPGGKIIRALQTETNTRIEVEDSGVVKVFAFSLKDGEEAMRRIKEIAAEPEVGTIYDGTVVKVTDFGAFVEILPGTDGLVHISQLADRRVKKVTDVVNEGDKIKVKVLDVSPEGKIRLSLKEALAELNRPKS